MFLMCLPLQNINQLSMLTCDQRMYYTCAFFSQNVVWIPDSWMHSFIDPFTFFDGLPYTRHSVIF